MNKQKLEQLQIRVSADQKKVIRAAAKKADMGMSEYVLSRLIQKPEKNLVHLIEKLKHSSDSNGIFAEVYDLLNSINKTELQHAMEEVNLSKHSEYYQNYIAALFETLAVEHGFMPPHHILDIEPLKKPIFGSELKSLRLYLLTVSPAAFRRRNIFIDTSFSGRV